MQLYCRPVHQGLVNLRDHVHGKGDVWWGLRCVCVQRTFRAGLLGANGRGCMDFFFGASRYRGPAGAA